MESPVFGTRDVFYLAIFFILLTVSGSCLQYPTVNTGSGYTYQEFNVILLSSNYCIVLMVM